MKTDINSRIKSDDQMAKNKFSNKSESGSGGYSNEILKYLASRGCPAKMYALFDFL